MTPSLQLEISSSRALCAAILILHASAALIPALLLPAWAGISLAGLIAVSALRNVRRYGTLNSPHSVIGVRLEQGKVHFATRAGESLTGTVSAGTFLSALLTVLTLERAGHFPNARTLLVIDNADPEDFRQLRVMLRWGHYRDAATTKVESEFP